MMLLSEPMRGDGESYARFPAASIPDHVHLNILATLNHALRTSGPVLALQPHRDGDEDGGGACGGWCGMQ